MELGELSDMMGQEATEGEALLMAKLLADRGIVTLQEAKDMPDEEFFKLVAIACNN